MNKIGVFEEIQYSFKILTNNNFQLVEFPDSIPINSTTLKNFALNKFWDKLWTLPIPSGECTLCNQQNSSAEHLIRCIVPSKEYNEFVLPLMDSYMRKMNVPAISIMESLDVFSRLNPRWSVALFRGILPVSLVEALIITLPTQLVLPILNRWSTLSTLWIYNELYLPLRQKEKRFQRRMSVEYISTEAESESDSDESISVNPEEVSYPNKKSQFPSPPDSDYDSARKPVFCI
ncbi:hypothetical protein K7432_006691 [Basidiobolus ranarum]|uniref:Reverse transcriptase zinc-binding domain-containing protein n=1 Tax=Basidiobolus ranarum TaxID=34480 RepID=A0ABR2WUH6_9FUNG